MADLRRAERQISFFFCEDPAPPPAPPALPEGSQQT